MSKADIVIKLMREKGWTLDEAEEFLADVPDDQEGERPGTTVSGPWKAGDTVMVRRGGNGADSPASRFLVAQRNPNGLTAVQQAGVDRGKSLCPNCQNPEDEHVPGCLRDPDNGFSGRERKRAITHDRLPPIS